MKMKKNGFTLVEMLLVLAILTVLMGTGIGGLSHMLAASKRARTQELVSNAATALAAIYVSEGIWPKALRTNGGGDGQLDAVTALPLAEKGQMSLVTDATANPAQLGGNDRFGLITPQAMDIIKKKGTSATLETKVTPETTVRHHILHYAIDLDGDGITEANVGGQRVRIRTSAAVWCIGLKGGKAGEPWRYDEGLKRDDVYSWVVGQTKGF